MEAPIDAGTPSRPPSGSAALPLPVLDVPLLLSTTRLIELPAIHLSRASDGSAPRLATALRIGLRGGVLLVRFDGRDEGAVATHTRRDGPLWTEDVFEVFLTPHDPPTTYYEFEVNPLGTVFDARIESPRLVRPTICVDVLWNCRGFTARAERREGRWSALLRIPLAALEPPPGARWRANFFRVDRAWPEELSAWSPVGEPVDFHTATRFGFLRFRGPDLPEG